MDYVVGSIAALISGNVTPNRPKLLRRALTPTKHPASPNVTPKSEAVDDRSIFLSPSVQKKKAIVKKSPKRIFENPDLDVTENFTSTSPKAEKVKKQLAEDLDGNIMNKSSNSPSKLNKSVDTASQSKKSKMNDSQTNNERTPKKNKRRSKSESQNVDIHSDVINESKSSKQIDQKDSKADKTEITPKISTPKKNKNKSKSQPEEMEVDQNIHEIKSPKKKLILETEVENKENKVVTTTTKKKNKKRKKKGNATNQEVSVNEAKQVSTDDTEQKDTTKAITETSTKKKKNRKNKKSKLDLVQKPPEKTIEVKKIDDDDADDDHSNDDDDDAKGEITTKDKETVDNTASSDDDNNEDEDESETEEVSNIANPNAITEKDSDSEHDSDDEIESDNETSNAEVLKTDLPDESSDEEEPKNAKKPKKSIETSTNDGTKEINTEEEIKRTLFVGNVAFSSKCKKEIKRIFSPYGEIETVRIRTIPVKDGRVTPKMAVIKNEIHPDRSTVNVYVKFADPQSVELALAENNTVLNKHHLRVSRSAATGVEHEASRAVFVGNLPFGIEDETLRARFQRCGEIHSVRIVRDKKTNAGKGFGYVNFESKDAVELALLLSEEDLTVKNRIIRVKRCTQTLSRGGSKKDNKGNQVQQRNFNQAPNRNFQNQGPNNFNNQGNRSFGNQGNRNFGNQGNRSFGNQGNRSFGNQGNRSFGNQGNRNFGNQGSGNFGNQGNRNFRNQGNRNFNQGQRSVGNGPNRNFERNPGGFGNQGRNFGNSEGEASGAARRLMNKRPHQQSGDGPPNKRQNVNQPPREKKQRKEFVGVTAEKKKKQKFDKGQKKRKAISEIMTKKS